MSDTRAGYLYGLAAYLLWGFFPLFFKLLQPAGAIEVLAHRVLWAFAFLGLVLLAARRFSFWRTLAARPSAFLGIGFASCIIALNWGTYIYGVNTDRVVETSLGYFINPLVTVLLGVLVLGERLRRLQWTALAIGALAVAVITVDYGQVPLIALTLACSFALYGLIKKRLGLPPAEGLLAESFVLAAPALVFLWWLSQAGGATFGQVSPTHTALMLASGAITAVPLLLFAAAANRIPLTGLGILQYIAPLLQFLIGVLVFREPMPAARLIGFVLVWVALMVFTTDAIRHARRARLDFGSAGAGAAGPVPVSLAEADPWPSGEAGRADVTEKTR